MIQGHRRLACAVLLAGAAWLLLPAIPASAAKRLRLVQTIRTSAFSPSSPDPAGIIYRPGPKRFLIADSEVDETRRYRGFNLFTARRRGAGFGSGTLVPLGNREPADLGFNPLNGTLYASNDDKDRISRVIPGLDGVYGTADDLVSNFSTAAFGSTDPEGVEYDPGTGGLFVCDGLRREIYLVNPATGAAIRHFDLARYGARDCEGLGIDRKGRRARLLAVDWRTRKIYKLSRGGDLRRKLRLSAIRARPSVVSDVTMAPTSNRHDNPFRKNYWIVDRHLDNKGHPNENDGLLYEMSARR